MHPTAAPADVTGTMEHLVLQAKPWDERLDQLERDLTASWLGQNLNWLVARGSYQDRVELGRELIDVVEMALPEGDGDLYERIEWLYGVGAEGRDALVDLIYRAVPEHAQALDMIEFWLVTDDDDDRWVVLQG